MRGKTENFERDGSAERIDERRLTTEIYEEDLNGNVVRAFSCIKTLLPR
jgi:hypothetical protein